MQACKEPAKMATPACERNLRTESEPQLWQWTWRQSLLRPLKKEVLNDELLKLKRVGLMRKLDHQKFWLFEVVWGMS